MTIPARGGSSVDLRRAFGLDASSVWVVTSAHAGSPVGFTAVSVVSVSLAPPILSFNVSRTSSSLDTLLRSGRYAVHLLAADQEHVARRFAGPAALRFAEEHTWTWDADGLPRLPGVVARLGGAVLRLVDAGDSLLVLGEVSTSEEDHDAADPLLHHARAYTRTAGRTSTGHTSSGHTSTGSTRHGCSPTRPAPTHLTGAVA